MLVLAEKRNGKLYGMGIADAHAAHRNRWGHLTTIGVPTLVGTSPAVVLLYRRGKKRACPGKLDLGGSGHVEFSFDHDLGGFDLEAVILRNAIREAQEELQPDRPHPFSSSDFHRFGEPGEWEHDSAENKEMSTLHFIRLPNDRSWSIGDSNQDSVLPVEFTFEELMSRFQEAPDDFADGAGRVLSKLSRDPQLRAAFEAVLTKVAAPV
jgi:hypothetical protein